MRLHFAPATSAGFVLLNAPVAWSQQLGGARTVDIPIVQILAGLLLCSLAAFAFALFLKRRSSTSGPDFRNLLKRASVHDAQGGISVLETRRLSPHADACRFTSGGRTYLVVVTASSCTVVSDNPCSTPSDDPEAAQ